MVFLVEDPNRGAGFLRFEGVENEAYRKAVELLRIAGGLFCDGSFEHLRDGPGFCEVLDAALNPARARLEQQLNGATVSISLDANYLRRSLDLFEKHDGTAIDKAELEFLAVCLLSSFCNAKLGPGFALAEFYSGIASDTKLTRRALTAFEYYGLNCDPDEILLNLVTEQVARFRPRKSAKRLELSDVKWIAENSKAKAELLSCLYAAEIERKLPDLTMQLRLERWVQKVNEEGAFAFGSIRYFCLYFSGVCSDFGVARRSMLKSIHSRSFEKAATGVLNAARDCYFASEYASSMNRLHKVEGPRVFVTNDKALALCMSSEKEIRTKWDATECFDWPQNDTLSNDSKKILYEAIQIGEEGMQPDALRPPAREVYNHIDLKLERAWRALRQTF
ncbi:hypothetical protein TRP8649_00817 [Pelagimonas phthalicica]|uniref:Uncharacterized protein n=1 Tax=Pelagimonas phthalicica TaxID=1037362 RepID=A0A238J9W0_9RHOB|nr:hypothetical protein [Pelagimonas phthalicica]TDS94740.1 hypothetical protein CLV87_1254 [Pelagimonas phthalicica]SMX26732.1 hypothetical protein TRP8649_00817 [Pelagimonas phthalicica]